MKRVIINFNHDDHGDWMAELICGHAPHVRHKPPWQSRPQMVTEKDRQTMFAALLECALCEQASS